MLVKHQNATNTIFISQQLFTNWQWLKWGFSWLAGNMYLVTCLTG